MMITPLLAILLLRPFSISAGEVDGKGLICDGDDELRDNPITGTMTIGVQFAGGLAQTEVVRYPDGVATLGKFGVAVEYEAIPT